MIELSNEIISADTLTVFFYAVISGILTGIIVGLLHRATWWLWH